jgi:2-C-methyl-D-erythritol 4-phosphate cytidylyltransferase
MAQIRGKSVCEYTIEAFENAKNIKEIILVVRKEDVSAYKDLIAENGYSKIKCIVTGGETRQISAFRGFRHISEKAKYVAIHDGARCLVTEEIIDAVLKEASTHDAAAAATKSTDTIKLIDERGFVKRTVDRDYIWSVQTPQIFDTKVYKVCAYNARQKGIEATDDTMLAEKAGFKVKLVDTGKENIKITYPSDLEYAEYVIKKRFGDM